MIHPSVPAGVAPDPVVMATPPPAVSPEADTSCEGARSSRPFSEAEEDPGTVYRALGW